MSDDLYRRVGALADAVAFFRFLAPRLTGPLAQEDEERLREVLVEIADANRAIRADLFGDQAVPERAEELVQMLLRGYLTGDPERLDVELAEVTKLLRLVPRGD